MTRKRFLNKQPLDFGTPMQADACQYCGQLLMGCCSIIEGVKPYLKVVAAICNRCGCINSIRKIGKTGGSHVNA